MAVYLADDGTGTIRLNVVHYDHSLNPMVRNFTVPQTIDGNSGDVIDAKVLLDRNGDGLVVWTQMFGGMARLFASVYSASTATFSRHDLIDSGGENAAAQGVNGFDAAMDTAGGAIICFFENPASPAVSEAFGIFFSKTGPAFFAPEKVDRFSVTGHPIDRVQAVAGPPGKAYVLVKQDADPGPGTVYHCSVSRFSSESSLSSFNAVTRVNPPGFDDDVLDFTGTILANGDGLFVYEQPDPISGYRRIWWRVFDFTAKSFEALPQDLAAQSPGLDFTGPVLAMRPDGVGVALCRTMGTSATLHSNVFDPGTHSFDTGHSTVVSPSGGPVGSEVLFAFAGSGSGEVVFTQATDGFGSPALLYATRFDGESKAFAGGARPCGLGSVETGSLDSLPMTFSDPLPVGSGFDGHGRFLLAFTQSDGRLHRLFVNRGPVSDQGRFEGARPVDGASMSPVFATVQTTSQVAGGSAALLLDRAGQGGVALWRHEEFDGTNTSIRLHGNSYHGFNNPPGMDFTGAQMVDEHPTAGSNRPVTLFDGAATANGAVAAIVQDSGGSAELYIRAYSGKGAHFAAPGGPSHDNGTTEPVTAVQVVPSAGDDATVYFLQDDGFGTVHLYGRVYRDASAIVSPLRGPAANTPLSNSGPTFGSVTHLSVAALGGRAFVAIRQAEGSGFALYGLRVDPDGSVTGPSRLSSSGSTQVGPGQIEVSAVSGVLTLFTEGSDLKARVLSAATFGQAPPGTPHTVASSGNPVGLFDSASDNFGNFLVVFESGVTGTGISIEFRRYYHISGTWETGPLQVSPSGTATLDYVRPVIEAAGGGRAMITYLADDQGIGDLSLAAVTYDSSRNPSLSTPSPVDADALALNGLDVDQVSIAVDPQSARGFIVFAQDADPSGTVRNRLYLRGFDLSQIGSSNPVFTVATMDLSAGGPSTPTEVTFFENAVGQDGQGFLVHGETLPAGPNATVVHLFARSFDAGTFTFGQAEPVSRSLNPGAGNVSGEGVESSKVLMGPGGEAFMLHALTQTDSGGPTTYRRLFANIYR
jgi:hypothetical protein